MSYGKKIKKTFETCESKRTIYFKNKCNSKSKKFQLIDENSYIKKKYCINSLSDIPRVAEITQPITSYSANTESLTSLPIDLKGRPDFISLEGAFGIYVLKSLLNGVTKIGQCKETVYNPLSRVQCLVKYNLLEKIDDSNYDIIDTQIYQRNYITVLPDKGEKSNFVSILLFQSFFIRERQDNLALNVEILNIEGVDGKKIFDDSRPLEISFQIFCGDVLPKIFDELVDIGNDKIIGDNIQSNKKIGDIEQKNIKLKNNIDIVIKLEYVIDSVSKDIENNDSLKNISSVPKVFEINKPVISYGVDFNYLPFSIPIKMSGNVSLVTLEGAFGLHVFPSYLNGYFLKYNECNNTYYKKTVYNPICEVRSRVEYKILKRVSVDEYQVIRSAIETINFSLISPRKGEKSVYTVINLFHTFELDFQSDVYIMFEILEVLSSDGKNILDNEKPIPIEFQVFYYSE